MNDDQFIRDLQAAQALDEAINALQADPTATDDDLAALLGLAQGIEPPADFVAQLDQQLQAAHQHRLKVSPARRYRRYGLVAVLMLLMGSVLLSVPLNIYLTTRKDSAENNLASNPTNNDGSLASQTQFATLQATEVALNFTRTPVATALAGLNTNTPRPQTNTPTNTPTPATTSTSAPTDTVTATDTPTSTATATPTYTPIYTSSPTMQVEATLPAPTPAQTASPTVQQETQISATQVAFPTSAPTQDELATSVPPPPTDVPSTLPPTIDVRATSTANFTRIIDDNANWQAYLAYRRTLPNGEGLPIEERHVIRVENSEGQPLAGMPLSISDSSDNLLVVLPTNIDGVAYFYPHVYTDTHLSFVVKIAGQTQPITRVEDSINTFVLNLNPPPDPLEVVLWVTEPRLLAEAQAIQVEGVTITVVQSLDLTQPLPDMVMLVDDDTLTLPADYPDFLVQLASVKTHTLAGAFLDAPSEYAWRQIAQFTGGVFVAYDPASTLSAQIISLIEEELE